MDLEAIQKMFDRLEQINGGIVTGINVLSHLIRLDVTKDTGMGSLRNSRTEMRIARLVCIAFARGNGYRMKVRVGDMEHHMHQRHLTYQADRLAEIGAGRKYAQNRYGILQQLWDLLKVHCRPVLVRKENR